MENVILVPVKNPDGGRELLDSLLADVYETRPDAIDAAVSASEATVLRMPRTEVENELAAAEGLERR